MPPPSRHPSQDPDPRGRDTGQTDPGMPPRGPGPRHPDLPDGAGGGRTRGEPDGPGLACRWAGASRTGRTAQIPTLPGLRSPPRLKDPRAAARSREGPPTAQRSRGTRDSSQGSRRPAPDRRDGDESPGLPGDPTRRDPPLGRLESRAPRETVPIGSPARRTRPSLREDRWDRPGPPPPRARARSTESDPRRSVQDGPA